MKRARSWHEQLCYYYGQPDHVIRLCLARRKTPDSPARGLATVQMPCFHAVRPVTLVISCCFTIPVYIRHLVSVFILPELIDSGAVGNFINEETAAKFRLPSSPTTDQCKCHWWPPSWHWPGHPLYQTHPPPGQHLTPWGDSASRYSHKKPTTGSWTPVAEEAQSHDLMDE